MTKRNYQEQERDRIRKAEDRNARPICRIEKMNDHFHVIGMSMNGSTFHEKFETLDDAVRFTKTLKAGGVV